MSELSFMEKLLDGAEVEWPLLGDIVKTVTAPAKLKRESYRETGRTPIIDQGIEFIAAYTDEPITSVRSGEYIIFGDHSEHIKYVDFAFVQGADGLKILSSTWADTKYIYHAFQSFYIRELNYKRHWSKAKETRIPIPCPNNPEKSLEIQSEIVRILDTFTELTAELTAELNLRKKQYNHYRDQLLNFEEGEVEWKTLGNVCELVSSGKNKSRSEVGKFPVYGSTGIIGRTDNKAYDLEQILVARVGANAGRVNIAQGEYDVSDNTLILKVKDNFKLKYLFYYLVNLNLNRFAKGAGQPLLTAGQLKDMIIPVPSAYEQKRIVTILDNFDTLTNSITSGLPREIELRQKQYEYYRDLLLSFPKPDAEEAA